MNNTKHIVTLDFETYYAQDYTLSKMSMEEYIRAPQFECIGVGIKIDNQASRWYAMPNVQTALDQIDWASAILVCHNTAFDGFILSQRYNKTPAIYVDTLSMARGLGLQAEVGGSLGKLIEWAQAKGHDITSKGNEVIAAKGKRYYDFSMEELYAYGEYCRTDVEGTYALFKIFIDEMGFPGSEMRVIDDTMRMYCEPRLRLDTPMLESHLIEVINKRESLLTRCGVEIGDIRSDAKFAQLLTNYGVEPPTKVSPTTGKTAFAFSKTDKEFLAMREHDDPEVQALVECRLGGKSTIEQSRTERFIGIAARGTLPFPLQYYAAHTGRFGGYDKINAQNLPRGGVMRNAIMAPPGHTLVVADSAQIEARVIAWLSGQEDLVEDFRKGVDIYSKFASAVFNREVTKADKTERFVGKTAILGLGYGLGSEKFRETLSRGQGGVKMVMTATDAAGVVDLYRAKHHFITALWKQAKRTLEAFEQGSGVVELGRPGVLRVDAGGGEAYVPRIILPNDMSLRYPGLRSEPGEKGKQFFYKAKDGFKAYEKRIYGGAMVENICQALARIVITDQWMEIKKRAVKERVFHTSPVVGQVHDELICCVPTVVAEDMKAIMIEEMSRAPAWAEGLPVACEASVADRYGEAK